MGINVNEPEAYQESIRKLFPRGSYWDKQFEDTKSDCSLFCKAKSKLLVRIRKSMATLQKESIIQTAENTLDDWERVLLGKGSIGLEISQRRAILGASKAGNINISSIKEIGKMYDVSITKVILPFQPAFFGHSFFGIAPIAGLAAFALIFIYAFLPNEDIREDFEAQIISKFLSNYIMYFIYGGE